MAKVSQLVTSLFFLKFILKLKLQGINEVQNQTIQIHVEVADLIESLLEDDPRGRNLVCSGVLLMRYAMVAKVAMYEIKHRNKIRSRDRSFLIFLSLLQLEFRCIKCMCNLMIKSKDFGKDNIQIMTDQKSDR